MAKITLYTTYKFFILNLLTKFFFYFKEMINCNNRTQGFFFIVSSYFFINKISKKSYKKILKKIQKFQRHVP